ARAAPDADPAPPRPASITAPTVTPATAPYVMRMRFLSIGTERRRTTSAVRRSRSRSAMGTSTVSPPRSAPAWAADLRRAQVSDRGRAHPRGLLGLANGPRGQADADRPVRLRV